MTVQLFIFIKLSLFANMVKKNTPVAANPNITIANYPPEESSWTATCVLDPYDNISCTIKKERFEEARLLISSNANAVIPKPFEGADWFREGWVCLYYYPFDIKMPFPFSKLVKEVLIDMQISPGQLMPLAWRILACLEAMEAKHQLGINVNVIKCCYGIKKFYKCRFGFTNKRKDGALILNTDAVNDRLWKFDFLFAEKSTMGDDASYLLERWNPKGTMSYTFPLFDLFHASCLNCNACVILVFRS